MRPLLTFLPALRLSATIPALAQTGAGSIDGTIRDEKGQAIEAVTITLLHAKDSARLKQAVTDKAGHFNFDHLPAGKSLVSASSVGYGTRYSPAVELSA